MIYIGALLLISIVWYLFDNRRKRNNSNRPPLTQGATGDTKQENHFSFTPTIEEPPALRDCEKVIYVKDGKKAQGTVRIVDAGLQVFDKNGNVVVDITDRICRYLGEGSTGFEAGFVTNDVFLENVNAWVLPKQIYLKRYASGVTGNTYEYPRFYVSGNRLGWKYNSPTNDGLRESFDFYYGVF